MLAHRARTGLSIALAAAATGVALLTPSEAPPPEHLAATYLCVEPPARAAVPAYPCPTGVRELAHVGADAQLSCVRGQFAVPGWYVRAEYQTTERWERTGVVSDDVSRVVVTFTDQPIREGDRFAKLELVDLEADGIDEIRTRYDRDSTVAVLTRKITHDDFAMSYRVFDREY